MVWDVISFSSVINLLICFIALKKFKRNENFISAAHITYVHLYFFFYEFFAVVYYFISFQ